MANNSFCLGVYILRQFVKPGIVYNGLGIALIVWSWEAKYEIKHMSYFV